MLPKNILKYGLYSTFSLSALYYSTKVQNNDIRMGIIGLLGQVTTDFIFHPLDLINTRTKFFFNEKINALETSKRILTTTGWTGLFRGGSVTILGSSFSGFIYFSTYKKLKILFKKMLEGESDVKYIAYTLATILSELIVYPLYYPFDLIKTRILTGQYLYRNFWDGIKKIYFEAKNNNTNIIKAYYTGFVPSLALNLSQTFLVFFTFEITRDYYANKRSVSAEEIKGFDYFVCTFISGFVTSASLNFLEVYSIQKIVNGDKINFRKFMSVKNFYAMQSGLLTRMFYGIFYTIFLLESINIYGKFFNLHL